MNNLVTDSISFKRTPLAEFGDYMQGVAKKEMVDLAGKRMFGIGDTVDGTFIRTEPAKICESGIRHIKGHCYAKYPQITKIGSAAGNDAFRLYTVCNSETVYYDLDYSKFKV